jgi:hypothetical protein
MRIVIAEIELLLRVVKPWTLRGFALDKIKNER